jgi:hypothetical protein
LKTWKTAQSPDAWEEAMTRAILCGVSTRDQKRERNIRRYLSQQHWMRLGQLFADLHKAEGSDAAIEALEKIQTFLSNKNKAARFDWSFALPLARVFVIELERSVGQF